MHYTKITYLFVLFSTLLCACGEYQLEDGASADGADEAVPYTFHVVTRSDNNAQINYPLTLFLFDAQNQCIQQETIDDASVSYSNTLPSGEYTLILLSGISGNGYDIPFDLAPDSYISFKDRNFAQTPIQMAQAHIALTKSTSVQMTLSYVVASVSFILNDVPVEATGVTVQVSPVSSSITLSGNYKDDNQVCRIPCTKDGDQWVSDTVYLFPGESSSTHMSVQIELPDGDKAYGYTYQSSLLPAYPYQFTGNYKDGITLNGEFQAEGWYPAVDVEFGMSEIIPDEGEENPGGSDDSGTDLPADGTDTYWVDKMPEEEEIWESFYVWKITSLSATESEAVIIASEQKYDTALALQSLLGSYRENGIGDWRVFTKEEARLFRSQYMNSLINLNSFLRSNGHDPFYDGDEDRYLCDDCSSSFSFVANTTISKVGTKRSYYLRPVKEVRLKLK